MGSRYAKGAVLVLAVLVLAVEGYFGYRWYQQYYGTPEGSDAVSSVPGGEGSAPKESVAEGDGGEALVHQATRGNIVDNSTYIDHPASNGNPDAVLLITQARNTRGTPAAAHATGVWYDENRGGKWAIFNQDLDPMLEGAVFNVVVSGEPSGDTFVHRASPANTDSEVTYVDHPSVDAAPDAVLLITPNWNPGGGTGTYNDHQVGVWYDDAEERWTIRNEDLAAMPDGAAFGVSVLQGAT